MFAASRQRAAVSSSMGPFGCRSVPARSTRHSFDRLTDTAPEVATTLQQANPQL
jgi:hypothetical protein